jgi:hypothetical protein
MKGRRGRIKTERKTRKGEIRNKKVKGRKKGKKEELKEEV